METEQRVEHTGGGKPNRIENLRTDPGGELTAGDAYELDMWRVALAENRRKRELSDQGAQLMTRGVTYRV